MNNVFLIGRLTRDIELRYTSTGKAVGNFSLAVNRSFSKENEADFFNVVVWDKTAENCANYLAKGRLVAVEGRLQSRTYETNEGQRRHVVEVVANRVKFLEWGEKQKSNNNTNFDEIDIDEFQTTDDEDIPF